MSSNNDPFNSQEVNDLENSIEQAIDDLFVPIEGADDSFALADMDGPPTDSIDKLSHPEMMEEAAQPSSPLGEDEPTGQKSQDLLEPLNECLLSLDWEINLENIKNLQDETNRLAGMLKNDRHSMIIIKMVMMVLKYLLTMKEESSPVSINLLHTAVKCLELFHKPHNKTENEVSDLLIDLKNEFRSIKNEIITPSMNAVSDDQMQADEAGADDPASMTPPSVMTRNMQDLIMQMSEIFSIMQKGVARLSFMDNLFDKNPALAEAAEYFNEVKKDFLNKINDAVNIETNLLEMVRQLNKKIIEAEESMALSGEAMPTASPSPVAEAGDDLLPGEEMASSVEDAGGDMPAQTILPAICVTNIENHMIGIPESFVANVFEISPKKVQKFNDRGYVTLLDFSRRFRSIKKGLGPNLNGLSAKVLKTIKFPIIKLNRKASEFEDMDPSESSVKGIILLSNGSQHAALFTDEVMDKKPQEITHYDETRSFNEISGTATVEGDETAINVIDVEYILSYIV